MRTATYETRCLSKKERVREGGLEMARKDGENIDQFGKPEKKGGKKTGFNSVHVWRGKEKAGHAIKQKMG